MIGAVFLPGWLFAIVTSAISLLFYGFLEHRRWPIIVRTIMVVNGLMVMTTVLLFVGPVM
jgi:hypothetical protein